MIAMIRAMNTREITTITATITACRIEMIADAAGQGYMINRGTDQWRFKRVAVTELEMAVSTCTWLLLSLLTIQIARGHDFSHPVSIDDRLTLELELNDWGLGRFARGNH